MCNETDDDMNILFYRYNSICEPDILGVLTRLGHKVTEVTEEMKNKKLGARGQMNLVSAALKKQEYQMVFSVSFFPVISEVCNIFHIPYVSWVVDCPAMELYSHSVRNSWNRIFLFDYALYEEFRSENPKKIFYLPLGADYVRLDSLLEHITRQDREKYAAEVSFVGSLYTEKCPYNYLQEESYLKGYLDGVTEAQVKVYGYNFLEECITEEILQAFKEKVPFYQFPERAEHNEQAAMAHLYLGSKVTEQERLRLLKRVSEEFELDLYTSSDFSVLPRASYRGIASAATAMPKIFHLSRINLNFTSKPIRTGLPLRFWDILGAGGFLLTNYQSEIPEYFEIGKDLEIYASEKELTDKIRYYLEHEEERAEIARNGYEKAKEKYSLEIRICQMMRLVH